MVPRLILFDGLPGTGKSSLAQNVGQTLGIPVLGRDWIAAALLDFLNEVNPNDAAHAVMAVIAERQFALGHSVIFDCVVGNVERRTRWTELAAKHGAALCPIQCICSDAELHRARMEGRQRGIPGWPELTWDHVEEVRSRYELWPDALLTVDSVNSFEDNLRAVLLCLKEAVLAD